MKKTFTLVTLTLLTIASTSLHAQLNKGSIALGGNLNFNTVTTDDNSGKYTSSSFYIAPSLTSFYKDNRAFGFYLSYLHSQSDSISNGNSYGGGAFLRQYKPLGKGFYVFVQELLGYSYFKSKNVTSSDFSFKNNILSAEVNPGLAYDLNKKLQFEILFFNDLLSANYINSKNTSSGSTLKQSQFSLGANTTITNFTSVNVGAKIFFGR